MSNINVHTRYWDRIIALGFLLLLSATFWPTSWWFDVDRVHVRDAKVGEAVIMEVDRNIKRPFDATWDVALRRQTPSGWVIVCTAQGATDYSPDASFPDPLTLAWWTNDHCGPALTPGRYRLHTTWQLEPDYNPTKRVKRVSNIFEVKE